MLSFTLLMPSLASPTAFACVGQLAGYFLGSLHVLFLLSELCSLLGNFSEVCCPHGINDWMCQGRLLCKFPTSQVWRLCWSCPTNIWPFDSDACYTCKHNISTLLLRHILKHKSQFQHLKWTWNHIQPWSLRGTWFSPPFLVQVWIICHGLRLVKDVLQGFPKWLNSSHVHFPRYCCSVPVFPYSWERTKAAHHCDVFSSSQRLTLLWLPTDFGLLATWADKCFFHQRPPAFPCHPISSLQVLDHIDSDFSTLSLVVKKY